MSEDQGNERAGEGSVSLEEVLRERRFRIFVLGAGFSAPAGMPLGVELWREVRQRAGSLHGRAEKFQDDVADYLAFRKECFGEDLTVDSLDFEDFLGFLDVEYHLGLRGSDTWSVDGNEGQVVVKTLIGEILSERMPAKLPDAYFRFAESLQPGDYVLTFNYDVLLERALKQVGKPFRLFPQRYKELLPNGGAMVDWEDDDEVVVLKLHGSIDWFDRTSYSREVQASIDFAASIGRPPSHIPGHPVFSHSEELGVVPILDGLRHADDPLCEMHRVECVEGLRWRQLLFRATPWLLSPSRAKVLWAEKLKDFWRGLGQVGRMNLGLGIVGFSLPDHDDYVRQVIYRFVKNYEAGESEIFGLKRNPIVLVDRRMSSEEVQWFRRRYSFVDWEQARVHLGGFDEQAVEMLFCQT